MARDEDATPTPLTFSHATFAKLTPNAYLQAHLQNKNIVRPNGRGLDEIRNVTINTGSLANSNGSAVVRLGDTAVVCGVRGEILLASDIPLPPRDTIAEEYLIQHLGLLVPNLELSTGCSPAHLPGNPPSALAQSLSWRIHTLLHTTNPIDIDNLRIRHTEAAIEEDDAEEPKIVTKAYWTLYLDILCMSLDGNCFDAAWIAIMAALRDTKLPKAIWDVDREIVVCSPHTADAVAINLHSTPIPSTFASFTTASPLKDPKAAKTWTLADPDAFEESACTESLSMTVDQSCIVRLEKFGSPSLDASQIKHCLTLAMQRRKEVVKLLQG